MVAGKDAGPAGDCDHGTTRTSQAPLAQHAGSAEGSADGDNGMGGQSGDRSGTDDPKGPGARDHAVEPVRQAWVFAALLGARFKGPRFIGTG
jgi:hypothetical protein